MKYTWAFWLFSAVLFVAFVTGGCQSRKPSPGHPTHEVRPKGDK